MIFLILRSVSGRQGTSFMYQLGLREALRGNANWLTRHCGLPTRPSPAVSCMNIALPCAWHMPARSRHAEKRVRLLSMRGKYVRSSSSISDLSIPKLTGMSPVVMSPTPPRALSSKYFSIFSLGRPVSSHMSMLPIGAMTSLFFSFSLFTWIGSNIEEYG